MPTDFTRNGGPWRHKPDETTRSALYRARTTVASLRLRSGSGRPGPVVRAGAAGRAV